MLEPRVFGDLRVTSVGGAVAALKAMILAAAIPSAERWWEAAPVHRLSAVDTLRDPFCELPEPSTRLTYASSPPCTRPCNIHQEVTSQVPSWDYHTKPHTPHDPTRLLRDPTVPPHLSQPSPLIALSHGVT